MKRTIYLNTFSRLTNYFKLNERGNILGNYSCYSKLFYQNDHHKYLSRTAEPINLLSKFVMFETPASSQSFRFQSTNIKEAKQENTTPKKVCPEKVVVIETLSRTERLKKAVKEYGSTVIVFHIGISLISLGASYLAVSTGLDATSLFDTLGLKDWISNSSVATNAGTFAVAYAIHKVFAPVRITITLASVPFIVRYLRKIGFLKK